MMHRDDLSAFTRLDGRTEISCPAGLVGRRAFLHGSALVLAAAGVRDLATRACADETENLVAKPAVRVGVVTDLHYADKPPAGTRHYRETLTKLAEAVQRFQECKPDFIVELGDFIDSAPSVETELSYLRRVNELFVTVGTPHHYVLGNHCVDMLTKEEFLRAVEQPKSFYSFDRGGFHFVVVDACFRSDGEPYGRKNAHWQDTHVPAQELEWLKDDLAATKTKTVVFAHQRLDDTTHHSVKNNSAVRQILEQSGRVLAVFQGHSHQNDYQEIGGIHYCTLAAMVEGSGAESNSYGELTIQSDGSIRVEGFRRQKGYALRA